jgi:enoyl-CoA hydratase
MPIEIHEDGRIAVVVINRPEALNAFDAQHLRDFISVFRDLSTDKDVRAVVLTGAGDRAFAAGADIRAMRDMDHEAGREFGRLGHGAAYALESLPQPVIAAVNGFALGGGCELALASDIRLASENAVFAQPEVGLGICPGWGATQRLPRIVGPGIAAELIFTGRRVIAEEALRIGLVNAVYPTETLIDKAKEMAHQIAANSPMAIAAAKQAMAASNGDSGKGLAIELDFFARSFSTHDQHEGMTAFLEKRKPAFTGS